MAARIYNPVIPFVYPIPRGMCPGRTIKIQGSIPPGAMRFDINFQCGPDEYPHEDIAFHLNPRFVGAYVVRNHFTTSHGWGVEETSGVSPLHRGECFEAVILCGPNSIKIALNGRHFCEFVHRLPFQRISHLAVHGDVMIQFLDFEVAAPPPSMAIPFVRSIPGGMYPGRMIKVQGHIPPGAKRFDINFQCGPNEHLLEDIAFHLNPRFAGGYVVRNHFTTTDGWGMEETSGGSPLKRGDTFEAVILCEMNSMKVALNGRHFCEYVHRLPFQRISHLSVHGDVIIQFLDFGGPAPPPSIVVPFVRPIPGGMCPGRLIRVQGHIFVKATRFDINFQCGPNGHPHEDIAFHLNPRFERNYVVRNHFTTSHGWGAEETSGISPLTRGESFEAVILCDPISMKVALNGLHFCEFVHRLPFQRISHLAVHGDVIIQFLDFGGAAPSPSMIQPAPPHQRQEPFPERPDNECKICCENRMDAVFIPCGHMCACHKCALNLWQGEGRGLCPMCRAQIQQVQRVFNG